MMNPNIETGRVSLGRSLRPRGLQLRYSVTPPNMLGGDDKK